MERAGTEQGCWQCGAHLEGVLACPSCEAIQPLAPDADLFVVLGLPRRLRVDGADLERRYHEASRRVHPDRHQIAGDRARDLSLAASAAVNRAYRTLRDPVGRGRYWLELHGTSVGEGNQEVPPALVAEVFEAQESLEALRTASEPAARARLRVQVTELRDGLADRLAGLRVGLEALYGRTDGEVSLEDLRRRLSEIAYLRTLLGDVEDAIGEGLRGTDHRH